MDDVLAGGAEPGATASWPADLAIRLVGPFRLVVDGVPVEVGRARERLLLALLALRAPRVVPISDIVRELWPDVVPASASGSLQAMVSRLRRALASAGVADPRAALARQGAGYLLSAPSEAVDLHRVDRLLATPAGGLEQRRAAVGAAALLVADDLATDLVHGPALTAAAAGHARRRRDLATELLALRLDLEGAAAVLPALEAAVLQDPDGEGVALLLVLARYRSGDQAGALEAWRRWHDGLAAATGISPGPAAQRLQRAVLAGSLALLGCPARDVLDAAVPLPVPSTALGSVPAPTTPLLGRVDEVARVQRALDAGRLVTLTGPGGIGKTRLALEVARLRAVEREGGAAVLDLAGLAAGSSADRLAAWAQMRLELPEAPGRGPLAAVVRAVAPLSALLVLDNCEHVLDATRELVAAVLAACPGVVLLCTSRTPLDVEGEQRIPVSTLPVPPDTDDPAVVAATPSGRLFAARARAIDPSFELDGGTARDVARACRAVDGFPLALEIAAARLPVLGIDGLSARLPAEVVREQAAPPGEARRTLAASLGWSRAALPDDSRRLFGRMAVLPAPSTLRTVARVAGTGEDEAIVHLGRILAASLAEPVTVAGRRRFRMLEPVRQFALAGMDDAELAAAHRGRRDHVLQLADDCLPRLLSDSSTAWRADLRGDAATIAAALDHAWAARDLQTVGRVTAGLSWYWLRFGGVREAARWLRRAVAVAGELDPQVRAGVLTAAGQGLWNVGQVEAARALTERAHDLYRSVGDEVGVLYARPMHAWMVMEEDVAAGIELATATAGDAQRAGHPWAAAGAGNIAADGLRRIGDLEGAARGYAASAAVFGEQLREPWGRAWSLLGSVQVRVQGGAPLPAVGEALQDYLATIEELRFGPGVAMGVGGILLAAEQADDLPTAGRAVGHLDVLAESMGTDWLAFLTHDARASRRRVAARLGADALRGLAREGAAMAPADLLAAAG